MGRPREHVRELVSMIEDAGCQCRVEMTRSNHYRLTIDNGHERRRYFCGSTPSDRKRARLNAMAQVRRILDELAPAT